MFKKTACYVFLVLCSIPAYSAEATLDTIGNRRDGASSQPGNSTDTRASDNNGKAGAANTRVPNNEGDGKDQIQDPSHPMVYCREHTC